MIAILKHKYYEIVVFCLLVSLSFSVALPFLFLGILVVFFFVKLYKKEIKFPHEKGYYIFSLLFVFILSKSIFRSTLSDDFSLYSRFLIVIVLPFLFVPVSKKTIELGTVLSVLVAISIAVYKLVGYYLVFNTFPLSNDAQVNDLLVIERPYFGFICLIAIIICLTLKNEFPKYVKTFYFLGLIFILFILFIVARLSLLTSTGLLFIYILFYSKFSLWSKAAIILTSISLMILAMFSYKNLSNRFFVNENFEKIKDYEPRFIIWQCASETLNRDDFNIIIGAKSNKWIQEQLDQCYGNTIDKVSKRDWYLESHFNTHNQFLGFLLLGGLIGISFFLYFIFSLFKVSVNNFYKLSIFLSLTMFLIMENVFYRQFGCFFIATIISILHKEDRIEIEL